MDALSGLMPDAMYRAAEFLVASSRSLGSCGSVMACKSTTQKKVSGRISTLCQEHVFALHQYKKLADCILLPLSH